MTLRPREDFKIYQSVFDNYTMKTLIDLAGKKLYDCLDFPISTGKEADVYRATTKKGKFVAIKIYRIETSNFRAMQNYLIGDPRFRKVSGKRMIVETWCQKEFRNLCDALKAGVNVPKPIKAVKNVLIMQYLGDKNGSPYPLLQKCRPQNAAELIRTLNNYVEKLWKAGLVHGDLNEFNVVMKGNTPVLIDIGQAMSVKHPMAEQLLHHDLQQIQKLARKYGVSFNYEQVFNKLISSGVEF